MKNEWTQSDIENLRCEDIMIMNILKRLIFQ